MIRPAEFGDLGAIVDLFEEAAEKSRYSLNVDRITARQIAVHCIVAEQSGDGGAVIFVSETNGELTGLYVGMAQTFYQVTDLVMASPLLWYARDKSGWKLFKAFEEWASRKSGKVILRVGITDGIIDPAKFTKAMERKGYRPSGLVFEKDLEQCHN